MNETGQKLDTSFGVSTSMVEKELHGLLWTTLPRIPFGASFFVLLLHSGGAVFAILTGLMCRRVAAWIVGKIFALFVFNGARFYLEYFSPISFIFDLQTILQMHQLFVPQQICIDKWTNQLIPVHV